MQCNKSDRSSVYMPKQLKQDLKEEAQHQRRSVNNLINVILSDYIESRGSS